VAKAYRRIAAHGVHPDAGGDEQTFRRLTRARDILMDSGRLADYTAARNGSGFAHPSSSTRAAQAGPPQSPAPPDRSPAPSVRGKVHPLLVIALLLAFTGPLLWPLAIVTGLFGLWRINRSG
jgi:curved DNA-binding protein CbpA